MRDIIGPGLVIKMLVVHAVVGGGARAHGGVHVQCVLAVQREAHSFPSA